MALQGMGNRLKEVRLDRGFTQKKLAGLLGVTEQAVSKWERETSCPDISLLSGISEVLDCSPDYLFGYEAGKKNLLDQDSVERRAEVRRHLLPDIISLHFGEGLVPLFLEEERQGFPHICHLRCQIASQWGVVIPSIRLMDQLALEPDQYQIRMNGISVQESRQDDRSEKGLNCILEKLKAMIWENIGSVLNNQSVYHMVENLRSKYPYVVENIVPEVISYSRIRQVILCLLKDHRCSVNPLILIIESMEQHGEITDPRKLAEKIMDDMGDRFIIKM